MARTDLLINGRLSTPFVPFRSDDKRMVASGWAPWWAAASDNAPDWKNRTPVYSGTLLDGGMVQQIATPYGTHQGGLWQQVPAAAGNEYEFAVEGQGWSSEDAKPASQLEASDVNLQIGVDPTGGLDPDSPLIVWSDPAQPLSHWQTMRVNIVAEAAVVTLFLKSAPTLPKRQNSVFWRNAALRPIGPHKRSINIVGRGDTHVTIAPENPHPGDRITVTVSALRQHEFVSLLVRDPDEAETAVADHGLIRDDDRTLWRYEFEASTEGLYEIRFVGDGGARLLALRLLQIAREVQIVPSAARDQYTRVYVLLPPTADEKWLLAAARGSFAGRFTIGFSADDAGLGDLDSKQVIAVNPHHWPQVLTAAWFQQHYPGAVFTAVLANSPHDLEAWLKKWTPDPEHSS